MQQPLLVQGLNPTPTPQIIGTTSLLADAASGLGGGGAAREHGDRGGSAARGAGASELEEVEAVMDGANHPPFSQPVIVVIWLSHW